MIRARRFLIAAVLLGAALQVSAKDGALDTTFGGGTGKVQLPAAQGGHVGWTAAAVAVQSTGKIIIAGSVDAPQHACVVLRLNADGSLDTTFGGVNTLPAGYAGYFGCTASGVALLPDNSIILASNGVNYTPPRGFITHFTANGAPDLSFGTSGSVMLTAQAGGDVKLGHVALDSNFNIIVAGRYTRPNSDNEFYIVRATPNGKSVLTATLAMDGSPDNQAGGSDVAIAGDGSYYVAGYAKSLAGYTDCAVAHFLYDNGHLLPYATFSGSPGLRIDTSSVGNRFDECPAIALQPSGENLVLGGRATFVYEGSSWSAGTTITQPIDGSPIGRIVLLFDYDQQLDATGDVNSVLKALIDPYDGKPIMIGSGPNHPSNPPTGNDMGVVRIGASGGADWTFANNGFGLYDVGSTLYEVNRNTAVSAALWHGSLIVVGTAQDPLGGTNIAAVRLARFDGVFRSNFE